MNPKPNEIKVSSAVFFAGLAILLVAVLAELPFGSTPSSGIGQEIIAESPGRTGAANTVTSVVLGYRGLDTLGELIILFTAATAAGMVLAKAKRDPQQEQQETQAGFILRTAADVLYPFLMLLGAYIIVHGHLTPGGGFQGGAILAVAFFLPLLARPTAPFAEAVFSLVETLAGSLFIVIGLLALLGTGHFLEPLFGTGTPGELFSAGTLPLLYLAVGLKVGTELAGMLARLMHTEAGNS